MKRTVYFAALALALALVSAPVLADHITEPTAAISGIRLTLFRYAAPAGTIQQVKNDSGVITYAAGCNGSVVVDFDNLRVETDVRSDTLALAGRGADPSEHFKEQITLFEVFGFGTHNETRLYDWSSQWKHTNIPPHAKPGGGTAQGWESSQNNQNLIRWEPGTVLRFTHEVQGMESGVQLEESCTFVVG